MSAICNTVDICFLSTGSYNFSKSIFITSQNKSYLINCGEGIQKLFHENGKNINSLSNIFLTSKSSINLTGLIGVGLGMVGCNSQQILLHGVKEGQDIMMLSKTLLNENILKIKFHEESVYQDQVFKIDKFSYGKLIDNSETDICFGYLFSTPKLKPKLDVKKCADLGIPNNVIKSSKMAEFFKQTSVQIYDNLIIDSKDVLIESPIPESFLVVECPSVEHIPGMSNALPYENLINSDRVLRLVVHLTERNVSSTSSYRSFIERIDSHFIGEKPPIHVIVDSSSPIPHSYACYHTQTIFNRVFDSEIFPQFQLFEDYKSRIRINNNCVSTDNAHGETNNGTVVLCEPFMSFTLNDKQRKENKLVTEESMKLKNANEELIMNELMSEDDGVPMNMRIEKIQELHLQIADIKKSFGEITNESYPYITFLGTSSATPSKYRNVTSILIEAYDDRNVLFDCGECCLDRLFTMFGVEKTKTMVRNLQMICISHEHLDHHNGLYTLLKYREEIGDCKPCLILTTQNVFRFNSEIEKIFNSNHCSYECEWSMIELLDMEHNLYSKSLPRTTIEKYEKNLNMTINPVRVFHTNLSYGFVLSGTKKDGNGIWKITYSGDCLPIFDNLVKEGMDSDILIHEATMDDGLEEMAKRKKHSTVSQAIEEGIKMKSKFTILTHFSSRSPLVPPLNCCHENVGQAFDFMRVNLQTCKYLNVFHPYFEFIFPRHWKLLETERNRKIDEKETPKSKKGKLMNKKE